jgi:hypothetical protein
MHALSLIAATILRITVDAPGPVEVPAAAVRDAGLALSACDLYGGATETAIPIAEKEGGFAFLAPVPTRHARRADFVLRPRPEGAAPARAVPDAEGTLEAPPGYYVVERNDFYDPLETSDRTCLVPSGYGGEVDYFYFGKPAPSQEHRIDLPPASLPKEGTVALLVRLQGERRAAASNGCEVSWNGKRLGGTLRWAGPRARDFRLEVDAKAVKPSGNTIRIDARDGKIRLDRVSLDLARAPLAPARRPARLEAVAPEDLLSGGADWVAVSVDACKDALAPLAAHREAQGLKTRVVRLRDVLDTFSAGNVDPRALRRFVERTQAAWSPRPRFLLLVGDAARDREHPDEGREALPAALVDTAENGASATDNWYVSFDAGRSIPSVAVGRFPVSSAEEAKRLVEKTIAYETRAPMGPWRRKLSFVAGEGRFGEAIDKAIEDLAIRIFNDYVPQAFEMNMTYASMASPYLWPPSALTDKVLERINEGAALLNYTGHGATWGFDDLRFQGKRYPLFRSEDVAKVKCGERRPLVFITACWTGCFDDPEDEPVGERLFEAPGGAAAVLAGSRVTHPFSNAVLSKELVAGLFGDGANGRRLGEAILDVKRRMLEAKDEYRDAINGYGILFLADPLLIVRLLQDDNQLYNLLGDPALVPAFPKGKVTLEARGPAVAGGKLKVAGKAEGVESGKALVSFEIQRKDIRGELATVELERPGFEKRIKKNYEVANEKSVARVEAKVAGGAFEAELSLPDDLLYVKHVVKAYAWSERADAAGSLEVEVTDGEE